jgi:hypothetical protein
MPWRPRRRKRRDGRRCKRASTCSSPSWKHKMRLRIRWWPRWRSQLTLGVSQRKTNWCNNLQQLAATSDFVVQLAAERKSEGEHEQPRAHGGRNSRPQVGAPLPHANHPNFGRHTPEEVSFHHSALPKLSFPKFNADIPQIWIGSVMITVDVYR